MLKVVELFVSFARCRRFLDFMRLEASAGVVDVYSERRACAFGGVFFLFRLGLQLKRTIRDTSQTAVTGGVEFGCVCTLPHGLIDPIIHYSCRKRSKN